MKSIEERLGEFYRTYDITKAERELVAIFSDALSEKQQRLDKAEAANRGLVEALEYILRVQVFEADVYYGDACRKAIEALANNPDTERYQAERDVVEAAIIFSDIAMWKAIARLQALNKDKGE